MASGNARTTIRGDKGDAPPAIDAVKPGVMAASFLCSATPRLLAVRGWSDLLREQRLQVSASK